jgi:hypothetical protein
MPGGGAAGRHVGWRGCMPAEAAHARLGTAASSKPPTMHAGVAAALHEQRRDFFSRPSTAGQALVDRVYQFLQLLAPAVGVAEASEASDVSPAANAGECPPEGVHTPNGSGHPAAPAPMAPPARAGRALLPPAPRGCPHQRAQAARRPRPQGAPRHVRAGRCCRPHPAGGCTRTRAHAAVAGRAPRAAPACAGRGAAQPLLPKKGAHTTEGRRPPDRPRPPGSPRRVQAGS